MTKFFSVITAVSLPLFLLFLTGCPEEEAEPNQGPRVTSLQVCEQVNKQFNAWGHYTVGQEFSMLNGHVTVEPDESRISRCADTLKDFNQRDLRYISRQFMPYLNSAVQKKTKETITAQFKFCSDRADANMSEKGKFIFINFVFLSRLNEATPNDLRNTVADFWK